MKILLKQDVHKIGKKGEILEVKEGYARNFLIPNGLAVAASDGAVKQVEEEKKAQGRRRTREVEESQALADKLKKLVITIQHKAGEEGKLFGSITSTEIAEVLKKKGFDVDKKKIILDEPIRFAGVYTVKLKLHSEVTAQLSLSVEKQ
jgi:large subunit ribosomal protein L9